MVPVIYEEVTGDKFSGTIDDTRRIGAEEIRLLRGICGEDELHFETVRALIDVERRYRTMARRSGLYDALEECIQRAFYEDEDDAVDRARRQRDALTVAREPLTRETDPAADIADKVLSATLPMSGKRAAE